MPYTPQNQTDTEQNKLRADAFIVADSYNLTPDFFNKNKERLSDISNSINEIVKSYGYNNSPNYDLKNPLSSYVNLLFGTIDKTMIQTNLMATKPSNLSSGMRSIASEDLSNNVEMGVINSFQRIVAESFSLMEEYRISVSLIPELKRVIKLIVRDIINANEITKRAIKDVYDISEKNLNNIDESDEDVKAINDIIDKEITDKYKIEEKLDIWLNEAMITGAKPILVLPYRDIIKQAVALSSNKAYNRRMNNGIGTGLHFAMEDFENKTHEMSFEEFENYSIPKIDTFKIQNEFAYSRESVIEEKGVKKIKYKYKSQEDKDAYTKEFREFVDDIISEEDVEAFFNSGMEELYNIYDKEKIKADNEINLRLANGMESAEEKVYETVNGIKSYIDTIENNTTNSESENEKEEENKKAEAEKIKEKIRERLTEFVCKVDNNINIVKDEYSALSLGKQNLYNKIKIHNNNKKFIDGIYVKEADEIDKISENFDREVLVQELNPEYVIPVSIGSEHIQYYIYEAEAYIGPTQSPSRRSTSFANIVASTGYGNDKALINASNGVSLVPNDPALSSVFNPANFGNINLPLDGNSIMENDCRTEIMKQIVYKTLAKRMAVVSGNCVRQGYIVDRQIRFTAVPATNIVYFAHDIDDKGMPHSVLDGTLLQIYMYLAGVVAMTMDIVKKSSDKEKLTVNMGMSKQIGMTLMEIQKQLSTRNVHVRSFFDNVGSVLRNVATYARYTVPVVDGEQLYDVQTVDQRAESPIDTDFIEKRLSSILSAIPCPPAIQNMINEAEFSRGLLNQNIEYRNSVMEKQNKYTKQITKLYRLIILYSKLAKPEPNLAQMNNASTKVENDNIKLIDIKNINVKLSPPMALNMININESFSNVEPVIDAFAKYLFGEDNNTPLDNFMIQRFKTECLKIFAPNIDFSYLEDIAQKIKANPFEGVADEVKKKIIAKKSESMMSGEGGDSGGGGGDDDSGGGNDFEGF